jgi:hypothetical protein
LEQHIKELKQKEEQRQTQSASRWEDTINELSRELEQAKKEVQQR